ncbi:mandelate racemase/muconate lactonizing enzyme family protein [candidate division KSB1 bacterium]|nr:mandelate racemase/muconate lactonizing enzyme family protein [candidate division KSB1 bacterium]
MKRRDFFHSIAGVGTLSLAGSVACNSPSANNTRRIAYETLDEILAKPILKKEYFDRPVIIESLELLRYQNNFIMRVRSTEGAEGLSVSNNAHMVYLYPILLSEIVPFFLNKDARDLDKLVDGVYTWDSNYKLQGLALWISLATVEFAILDMLGRIAEKSIGQLIGEIFNPKVAVYRANNYRGRSAEESVEQIKRNVESSGAKAVKIKIGGRMDNPETPPGRTEALIPLVRKTFGPGKTLYADSNGSYDVEEAIRIGRLLQEHDYDFYEEPCPFDWLQETRQVAESLTIPIAGGEQETSMHNFRWMVANDAVQIVQPDMFYFGGMIRSMRVALMADAAGMPCIPHISGSGLGYLYMSHFVSAIPNAGPYHEFKGFNKDIPFECDSSTLQSEDGLITVPTGPGMGLILDPEFVAKHKPVSY